MQVRGCSSDGCNLQDFLPRNTHQRTHKIPSKQHKYQQLYRDSMADVSNSKVDLTRLESTFYDRDACVVHTTYGTDLSSGKRNVASETRWAEKKELGSGGFGSVTLQEGSAGQLRAVKQMLRGGGGVDYMMELKSLTKVLDVCVPGSHRYEAGLTL